MVESKRQAFISVFPTALGWIAAAWRAEHLQGLVFNHSDPQKAMAALTTALANDRTFILTSDHGRDEATTFQATCIARLQAFAEGQPDDFLDISLDEQHLTPFQRRVIHYCRRIPAGKVLSYGQLAAKAGSPGAARAVGRVMATNRWPLIVPCHRVIAAGGGWGGYSAPEGLATKRRLLQREGVQLQATFPELARPKN